MKKVLTTKYWIGLVGWAHESLCLLHLIARFKPTCRMIPSVFPSHGMHWWAWWVDGDWADLGLGHFTSGLGYFSSIYSYSHSHQNT